MIDHKYDIENSGGAEFGPGMEPNVLSPCLQDIVEGEEILTNYDAYYQLA